jgi:predicted transcriptional regulator
MTAQDFASTTTLCAKPLSALLSKGVNMAQHNLGNLEQQVMAFLWKNGPATGDAVRQSVSKERELTDSTVRTVLRRLEAKGFVEHKVEGRQFVYSSARAPRNVAVEQVRNVLKKFCRVCWTSF